MVEYITLNNAGAVVAKITGQVLERSSVWLLSVLEFLRGSGPKLEIRPNRFGLIAFGIVAISVVLRFWDLAGASVDMDEGATRAFARLPLNMILFDNIDVHPPLTYALQHVWQSVFPDVSMMRVPAAVFGVSTIALVIFALRGHVSTTTALLTGLLLAVSTSHVFYSQDARQYPILLFGLVIAMYGALDISASRWRILAYAVGGLIAIYTHAIGLIAMLLIGLSGLLGGYIRDKNKVIVPWLVANIVILLLALPWLISMLSASASFKGLGDSVAVTEIQWFFRNAIGYPGIGKISLVFEVALVGLALLGGLMAFSDKKYQIAFTILGLSFAYPVLMAILHVASPILSTRTMLPSLLGVVLGASYLAASIRASWGIGLAVALVFLASASTFNELANRVKFEQNSEALDFLAEQRQLDAPVITCNIWTMAAVWETRQDLNLYNMAFDEIRSTPNKPIIHYRSPEYWRTLENGALGQQRMTPTETQNFLGDEWMIMGGLPELLKNEDHAVVLRSHCKTDHVEAIDAALAQMGFTLKVEKDFRLQEGESPLFIAPTTLVQIYEKAS